MPKAKAKNVGGAPRIKIDMSAFTALCNAQCTEEEIAAALNINKRTIIRRLKEPAFREAWERGRANGRASLRRLQWRSAQGIFRSGPQHGCATPAAVNMQLHLAKHWLGQTEKAALELTGKLDIEDSSADERLDRKLNALAERLRCGAAGSGPKGDEKVSGEPEPGGQT
jgi:hypothetical protein